MLISICSFRFGYSEHELYSYVKANQIEKVKTYLRTHGNFNLNKQHSNNVVVLQLAKTPSMAELLIGEGANFDLAESRIHVYIQNGNKKMIDWFLSHPNVNVDIPDGLGGTPLFTALKKNDNNTAKLLLQRGANCRYVFL